MVDYLLKPITFERFFKSVDRFLRESVIPQNKIIDNNNDDNYILLKSAGKNHKIILNDITYVESIKDYVKIHKTDGSLIMSKYKIGDLEEELPVKHFVRIHRSFIINKSKITAFSTTDIEVSGIELPIGASFKEQVELFIEGIKKV